MAYLFGLTESVPVAANAGHHAGIVAIRGSSAVGRDRARYHAALRSRPATMHPQRSTTGRRLNLSVGLRPRSRIPRRDRLTPGDTVDPTRSSKASRRHADRPQSRRHHPPRRQGAALPGRRALISGEPARQSAALPALIQTPTGPAAWATLQSATPSPAPTATPTRHRHLRTRHPRRGNSPPAPAPPSNAATSTWERPRPQTTGPDAPDTGAPLTTAQPATAGVRTPAGRPPLASYP